VEGYRAWERFTMGGKHNESWVKNKILFLKKQGKI